MRKTIGVIRPDTDAYRLVHGEGDFLPGLVVDVYTHSCGAYHLLPCISRATS